MPTAVALPLSTRISPNPKIKENRREKLSKLGDGYEAIAFNGKNPIWHQVDVAWESLTYTEFATITTAVASLGADGYFTWTFPHESTARKFRIDAFEWSYVSVYVNAGMSLRETYL